MSAWALIDNGVITDRRAAPPRATDGKIVGDWRPVVVERPPIDCATHDETVEIVIEPDRVRMVFSAVARDQKALLLAYAAECRWARETGGITVAGMQIASDVASQTKIAGAAQAAAAGLLPATIQFKTMAGFVEVTPTQVSGVYAAIVAHVQDCYAREATAAAGIAAETITTEAGIDAVFA